MKKIKNKFQWTTILVAAVLTFSSSSCKKFVEIPSPINQIVSTEVFANDQTATAAIIGIYSQMTGSLLYLMNGAMSVYPGLSADEIANTAPNTTYDPFVNNGLTSSNENSAIDNAIWRYSYSYIYQANAYIEGITLSTGMSIAAKQQLTGEAEFIRSICNFYLVNLFGPIPLITSTNYKKNGSTGRNTADLIYQQMVNDLLDASSLLSATYPSTGPTRPNKWAAMALLARVYLYMGDWKKAQNAASEIISSGVYSLVADLNNVFLANSPEAILQLVPVNPSLNSVEGYEFVPSSATAKPTFTLTTYLLNAFEANDQRKLNWLKSNTISGVVYTYPYKYKVKTGSAKTEYNNVLRLAEMYLIRAEAEVKQNDIGDAIRDINMIRNRAGLPSLSSSLSQLPVLLQ